MAVNILNFFHIFLNKLFFNFCLTSTFLIWEFYFSINFMGTKFDLNMIILFYQKLYGIWFCENCVSVPVAKLFPIFVKVLYLVTHWCIALKNLFIFYKKKAGNPNIAFLDIGHIKMLMQSCRIYRRSEFLSKDHRLVIATFRLRFRCRRAQNRMTQLLQPLKAVGPGMQECIHDRDQ